MKSKLASSSLPSALRVSPPVEFKFAGDDTGMFTGYASIFGNVDSYGEVVVMGAFGRSLARHAAEGTLPALLWSHDPAEPIGRCLDLREDATGLHIRGQFNLATDRGREAYALPLCRRP